MASSSKILSSLRHLGLITTTASLLIAPSSLLRAAQAQTSGNEGQPLTLLSDVQEANAITGVVTARGNVQIFYPARQVQATAVQAQYYSREGRIVLSGNVYVLQEGNSIQGETITYLIDEGRFVALPDQGEQVQSVYLVPGEEQSSGSVPVAAPVSDYNPKPEFKSPMSP
jgi:lipopolysaccharide export system protein LptA